MKKSKVFLTSTAVLLSALGANPVLARDVERSNNTVPVATVPTKDDKAASTASTDSGKSKDLVKPDDSSVKPVTPTEPEKPAPAADPSVDPNSEVSPSKPESTDPEKGESVDPEVPPVDPEPSADSENPETPATEVEEQIVPEESIPTEPSVLPEAWQPEPIISAAEPANLSVSSEVSKTTVVTSLADTDKKAVSEPEKFVELNKEQSAKREKDNLIDFKIAEVAAPPVREKVSASSPLLTDQGFQVIGSDKGGVVVQNSDGSQSVVPLAQVGGTANDDGSVAVQSSEGKFVLLPELGETTTLFATIGLFILALLGFKQIKPFEKDNWIIG